MVLRFLEDLPPPFGSGGIPEEEQEKMLRPVREQVERVPEDFWKALETVERSEADAFLFPAMGVIKKSGKVLKKAGKGKLPKYARSINLEKQALTEEEKILELKAADMLPPKKVQTWDETGEISSKILADYQKAGNVLNRARQGKALTAVETDVSRQIAVNSVRRLHEMSNLPEKQFTREFEKYVKDIFLATSKASSETGRALNIHKKTVSVARIGDAFAQLERGLNKRELAEFKALNLENPLEVKRFIQRLGDPKLKDYVYEFWYNSILSGLPTHVVNAATNTAWIGFQLPHRALTAGVDRIISTLTGKARTRYFNELLPMMAGYSTGGRRGTKAAWEIMRTGKVSSFETKWAQEVGHAMGAFERSPNALMRGIGKYLTIPTKALRSMDAWGNSIAFDGQARAIARRVSNRKGLKGLARKNFERKFIENMPDWAIDEARKFAKYSTFMDDPGNISAAIINLRGKVPGGRLLIPFVNTIGNLMKRGVEMTPGVGLVLAKGQEPAEVVAKQIEGSILALITLNKLEKGEITGGAPESKAEKEAFYRQKKKPWAMKIGDTWVQYRRAEPYNTVIASTAIAHEKIKEAIEKGDEETATQAFMEAAIAFKNNLIDSSYLQGMSVVFDRHGASKGFLPRLGASFIPYSSFWRSINRAYEAGVEGEAKVRDTDDWLGAFSQVIPGLHKKVPARLNVWGEEITLPGGAFRQWLPYRWSKETDDPVEKEFERLGIYPGSPGKDVTIRGQEVTLNDDVYRNYQLMYGHLAKRAVNRLINSREYQAINNDIAKTKMLDSIMTAVRNQALDRAKIEQMKIQQSPSGGLRRIGDLE